jgi:hypothetical protein
MSKIITDFFRKGAGWEEPAVARKVIVNVAESDWRIVNFSR